MIEIDQIFDNFFKIYALPVEDNINDLKIYYLELLEWNKKINLISRKSELSVLSESLFEIFFFIEQIKSDYRLDNQKNKLIRSLDIGSGGGIPGLMYSLILKDYNIKTDLLDSKNKKLLFLNHCISLMEMEKKVSTINSRIEDLRTDNKYDLIMSRGVGKIDKYLRYYYKLMNQKTSLYLLTGIDNLDFTTDKDYSIINNPYLKNRIIIRIKND